MGTHACRQAIVWDYRDIKMFWSLTSTKHSLKLRKMDVAGIFRIIEFKTYCCEHKQKIISIQNQYRFVYIETHFMILIL